MPCFVPCHLFGRLLCQEKALDSWYEREIPKNLCRDFGLLLPLAIRHVYLKIPRGVADPTILVLLKLLPKQKAILRTNMYLFITHHESFHYFLGLVHVSWQNMTFRELVTDCCQKCFEASSANAKLGLDGQ